MDFLDDVGERVLQASEVTPPLVSLKLQKGRHAQAALKMNNVWGFFKWRSECVWRGSGPQFKLV